MAWRYLWFDLRQSIYNVAAKADKLIYDLEHTDKKFMEDCFVLECFWEATTKEENPLLKKGVDLYRNKKPKKGTKPSSSMFTPPWIAEYIVRSTIGPLLKKNAKDFKSISNLKILDPCCGGGIFNVVAHDFIATALEKRNVGREYSHEQIGRIAAKTIYGVDIEPKAVEFTKMVINLNILRWAMKPKFKEFVDFADQSLPLPNPKPDKSNQSGRHIAQGHAPKKRSMKKTTVKKGKRKNV
ncbi:MAG TPA: DNA methyltransferase [Candidatus Babeliaceae bacterium]|nr:DNA methyltransferase [Candidatus Babeliaceae bacterium]